MGIETLSQTSRTELKANVGLLQKNREKDRTIRIIRRGKATEERDHRENKHRQYISGEDVDPSLQQEEPSNINKADT